MSELTDALTEFAARNGFTEKGALSLALLVTDSASRMSRPIDPNLLLAPRKGQVKGLSPTRLKRILAGHGIHKTLAKEAGRTSRGSVDNMRKFVSLLNELDKAGLLDFPSIQEFWINEVRTYFDRQPLTVDIDSAKSYAQFVRDLVRQVRKRDAEVRGSTSTGAVMQHLVGSKAEVVLGHQLEHHGYSVADEQIGRAGDFLVEDTAIHVTVAPTEALAAKCLANLKSGKRALIITLEEKVSVANGLLENLGIHERVDVVSLEAFMTSNLSELGGFKMSGGKDALQKIIGRYNELIAAHETDQSLRIEFTSA